MIIKLTSEDGSTFLLNTRYFITADTGIGRSTCIEIYGDRWNVDEIYVKETPEQILKIIKEADNGSKN